MLCWVSTSSSEVFNVFMLLSFIYLFLFLEDKEWLQKHLPSFNYGENVNG